VSILKNLRRRFDIYCYKNRDKGIPNLMLYIVLGTALVYLMSDIAGNTGLYSMLYFDRAKILQGQIWRLVTFPLTFNAGNLMLTAISLFCYYSIGRAMENVWGTLRFNLFYLTGVVMMDIYCMLFGGVASVTYLNLSLFLSYATMYPDAQFLLFFIIPVKAWIFALVDLAITVWDVIALSFPVFYFPYNFFPLLAIANYLLFFGKDVLNVIPRSWRINARRLFKKQPAAPQKTKVIRFDAGSYEASTAAVKAPYTHKCTVCGRTDVTNPELEFRYCSRCKGYHCYCEEHISNHSHVQ
jgi:membrane associated rhomboid family serine protease